MSKPIHLYNTADVKKVREKLLKEQKKIDPITKEDIPDGKAVLDHSHDTQFVRAVLHRQSNAVLGKIENLWTRYLSYWYNGTLSDFLRGCADYIDADHPEEYLHPAWIKRSQIDFNKLKESQKDEVLISLGLPKGTNGVERKTIFKKYLMSKQGDFFVIQELIKGELP